MALCSRHSQPRWWPSAKVSGPLVLLLLFLLLAVAAPRAVDAQTSLGCEEVWVGPDPNNNIVDCLVNSHRIQMHWRYYVFPGFVILFLIVVVIVLPITCLCCCVDSCCCRCCSCYPSSRTHLRKARCWLWFWVSVATVMGMCTCVMVIVGSARLTTITRDVLEVRSENVVDYITGQAELILDYSSNWTTGERKPVVFDGQEVQIDLAPLYSAKDSVLDLLVEIQDQARPYLRIVTIVSYCVGSVSFVLVAMVVLLAFCRCGNACSLGFCCVYYLFAILFGILAVVLAVVGYGSSIVVGEIQMQTTRQPGLLQWIAEPKCVETISLDEIRTAIADAESSALDYACTTLLQYCDNNPIYNPSTPEVIFNCGLGISSASQCTSFGLLSMVLSETAIKPELKSMFCTDTSMWEFDQNCTIYQCSQMCPNYETPDIPARTISLNLVDVAGLALNFSVAVSITDPMLDCNFLMDKAIELVIPDRYDLRASVYVLASGFFVGLIMYALASCILLRGYNIWKDRDLSADAAKDQRSSGVAEPIVDQEMSPLAASRPAEAPPVHETPEVLPPPLYPEPRKEV